MKATLISTGRIEDLGLESSSLFSRTDSGILINRRSLIFGLAAISASGVALTPNRSEAFIPFLIAAGIAVISVAASAWRTEEPVEGTLTLVNPAKARQNGNVAFTLWDRQPEHVNLALLDQGKISPAGLEYYGRAPYDVPPESYSRYWYSGPLSQRPGNGFVLSVASQYDQKQAPERLIFKT